MTADHARAVWGYGGTPSSATIAGQQGGYRTGRLFPVAPSAAGDSAVIRPYATTWGPTADAFGVAFPAGLVGVTDDLRLPSPLGGTINAGYETEWTGFLASIIPVPAVLPVGYTASLYDGWHSSIANLARRRTASGYVDATWLPTSSPNGITRGPLTLVGSGGTTGDPPGYSLLYPGQMTGFRKVQYRLTTAIQWLTMPTYDQTMKFSHNANGTNPGSALGDTLDATSHVTDANFSNVLNFFWFTNWIDVGQMIASTIGTLTYFSVQTDSSASPFSLAGGVNVEYRLSPRCDVPYPVSVHGQGDLIAPGGYP